MLHNRLVMNLNHLGLRRTFQMEVDTLQLRQNIHQRLQLIVQHHQAIVQHLQVIAQLLQLTHRRVRPTVQHRHPTRQQVHHTHQRHRVTVRRHQVIHQRHQVTLRRHRVTLQQVHRTVRLLQATVLRLQVTVQHPQVIRQLRLPTPQVHQATRNTSLQVVQIITLRLLQVILQLPHPTPPHRHLTVRRPHPTVLPHQPTLQVALSTAHRTGQSNQFRYSYNRSYLVPHPQVTLLQLPVAQLILQHLQLIHHLVQITGTFIF